MENSSSPFGSKIKTDTFPFFSLGEAYELGAKIGRDISENIAVGRLANTPVNMGILAQMLFYAEDGDHLEIGTLFGGSAILAALVKQHYNFEGKVICVDPLDGYYGASLDPVTGERVGVDAVKKNAESLGVSGWIKIVPAHSNPWPFEIGDRFKSAYIDGDHGYSGCLSDWENCRRTVTDFIILDNYDRVHAGVIEVVKEAICSPRWTPIHINDVSVVLAHNSKINQWVDEKPHLEAESTNGPD